MSAAALLIFDGAAIPQDTWWEGLLAMVVGVLAVLLFCAVVLGIRWLPGLEGRAASPPDGA
jgi:hypothetical protein